MGTLAEVVNGLPEGTLIKIGCKNSSGWFFCGTREEYIENVKDINNTVLERRKLIQENASRKLSELINTEPTQRNYVLAQIKGTRNGLKSLVLTREGYEEFVERYYRQVITLYVRSLKAKEQVENYVPIYAREVLDIYDSIDPESPAGSKNIQISGVDYGKYWFAKEYQNRATEDDEEDLDDAEVEEDV